MLSAHFSSCQNVISSFSDFLTQKMHYKQYLFHGITLAESANSLSLPVCGSNSSIPWNSPTRISHMLPLKYVHRVGLIFIFYWCKLPFTLRAGPCVVWMAIKCCTQAVESRKDRNWNLYLKLFITAPLKLQPYSAVQICLLLLLLFFKNFKAHRHKAAGRKTRLDIQNYGCNGNLLCYHGVVERNRISFLLEPLTAMTLSCSCGLLVGW